MTWFQHPASPSTTGAKPSLDMQADSIYHANTRPSRLLELDPRLCEMSIGSREFAVKHSLKDHPLLTLEALAEMADELPSGAVERHVGDQPILLPGGAPHLSGRPSETVRSITSNGRWMVLWNLEQIPRYKELLDEVLDEVRPFVPKREDGMIRRECFLFLSAPHSVTPVHFDPEHNFLLQIRGTKQMHVGCFPDRIRKNRELDRYYDGGHRNLEDIPPDSQVFTMQPGNGCYLYPWAPHWVQNGPSASISLSVTFRTGRSQCHEYASLFNRRLRRHGFVPRPAGDSYHVDRAKAAATAFIGWVRRRGRPQLGPRNYSYSPMTYMRAAGARPHNPDQ